MRIIKYKGNEEYMIGLIAEPTNIGEKKYVFYTKIKNITAGMENTQYTYTAGKTNMPIFKFNQAEDPVINFFLAANKKGNFFTFLEIADEKEYDHLVTLLEQII